MNPWVPAARLFLCLNALLPALGAPDGPGAPPTSLDASAIDSWLKAEVRKPGRLGMSVAIAHDGRILLNRGYGFRRAGGGEAVDLETMFPIGSVTKQFTCAAILLLAEDGKLAIRDPVGKYFPSLTLAGEITLLDLMNHVSGYPDYYPLDFLDRRMQQSIGPDELLRRYAGTTLDFEPGTRFSYSNTGFILLGRVVEKVSGRGLGDFLQARIFGPLGMAHTRYEPGAGEDRLANGYTTFALGDPEPVAPEGDGWLGGAGGIASTPTDLVAWDLALADGRVFQPDSWKSFAAPRRLTDGRESSYGCGIKSSLRDGRQVLAHNGAVSGFNANNVLIPSSRSAVAVVCNVEGGLGDIPERLLALVLGNNPRSPEIAGAPAADTARELFLALQRGKVDRRRFAMEFNLYLTDEKVAGAAARLRRFGRPIKAELLSANERGGMEVSTVRLDFKSGSLRTLMYRRPDGVVEQFFVNRD